MKDLEIRGAGNLLGGEQSGHIAGVGFDLYVRLVGEAVADFRGDGDERARPRSRSSCPSTPTCRTTTCRGSGCGSRPTRSSPASSTRPASPRSRPSCVDRYGAPPEPVRNLIEVARLRTVARQAPASPTSACRATTCGSGRVELPEGQQLRLQRLYPKSLVKDAVRTILVPKPMTARVGGQTAARHGSACSGPATSSAPSCSTAWPTPRASPPRTARPTARVDPVRTERDCQ